MTYAMVVLIIVSSVSVFGQSALPPDMHEHFDHRVAAVFELPAESEDTIRVKVVFENSSAQSIHIEFYYLKDGYEDNGTFEEVTVGYSPTAVCEAGKVAATFYVAGWSERTETTVVEQWSFQGPFALGTAVMQGGDGEVSAFAVPEISKEIILASHEMDPIRDIAINPFGNTLALLAGDDNRIIYELDIDTSEVTPLYSQLPGSAPSVEPELGAIRSLDSALHATLGFLVLGQERRPWETGISYANPYTVFVLTDADMDGVFDSGNAMLHGDYLALYGYDDWLWNW